MFYLVNSCTIIKPNPRIIAVCDQPRNLMYFTITFRSFSPSPQQMEFKPGQSYYFISTSSHRDMQRTVGGWCRTKNMKMIFRYSELDIEISGYFQYGIVPQVSQSGENFLKSCKVTKLCTWLHLTKNIFYILNYYVCLILNIKRDPVNLLRYGPSTLISKGRFNPA